MGWFRVPRTLTPMHFWLRMAGMAGRSEQVEGDAEHRARNDEKEQGVGRQFACATEKAFPLKAPGWLRGASSPEMRIVPADSAPQSAQQGQRADNQPEYGEHDEGRCNSQIDGRLGDRLSISRRFQPSHAVIPSRLKRDQNKAPAKLHTAGNPACPVNAVSRRSCAAQRVFFCGNKPSRVEN
jgi:hypothetical protein